MSTRAYLVARLASYLQDAAAVLTTGALDAALAAALALYSARKPRRVVQEYAGDGSTVVLATPTYWETSFSRLLRLYTLVGSALPIDLDRSEVWVEDTTSGQTLRLRAAVPSGTTLRVIYEGRHTATAAATTVPAGDYDAVALLGASLAADMLATHYAAQGESSLSADSVQHQTLEQTYGTRAKRLLELYEKAVPMQRHSTHIGVVRA